MSFTELIRKHLPEQSKQKSLALEWLTRRQQAGNATWSTSYVESRFSRCLSGEPAAVRFFFGQRDAAATLMDVLAVPSDEREALLMAADRHLENGPQHPPARMVIDLSRWSGTTAARALYESVRAHLIEPALVKPAVLVVTSHLHDELPRSFDSIDWLRVEVTDSEQSNKSIEALLADGALLVSPVGEIDPAHWLAIDFDPAQSRLLLEPADGLARFARDGQIPLPAVEHDLADVVADMPGAAVPTMETFGPVERRRLMSRLRSEVDAADVDVDPAMRFAMAGALGITATSTPRDRIEADLRAAIAGLGVIAPIVTTMADVGQRLDRARRRPAGPTVLRVVDEIHVINPPDGQGGLDHPRVRVHRVAAPIPESARLRAAIATWTIGDFEADPFLFGVLRRLDPDGRDLLAYLHARAWLLANGVETPSPGKPVDDWRAPLLRILAGHVPNAMVMLPSDPAPHESSFVAVTVPSWLAEPFADIDGDTAGRLRHVPSPLTSVPVGVRDEAQQSHVRYEENYFRSIVQTRLALPNVRTMGAQRVAGPMIDDSWLDSFEAFIGDKNDDTPRVAAVQMASMKPPPWTAADHVLSTTWLSLRMGVERGVAVRSESGTITLHLGGGLAAVIEVTATAEEVRETRAMLECTPLLDHNRSTKGYSLSSRIAAGVDGVQYSVPTRVVLLGERVRAEIWFAASPLLFGGATGDVAFLGARTAVEAANAEAEAARRRAEDYDD
jgi:hypothetical protein